MKRNILLASLLVIGIVMQINWGLAVAQTVTQKIGYDNGAIKNCQGFCQKECEGSCNTYTDPTCKKDKCESKNNKDFGSKVEDSVWAPDKSKKACFCTW